jgi:YidC/Oxa1 family membrane protein insertase
MVTEIRRREELEGLPPKELVEHGYGRLDSILAAAAAAPTPANDPPRVLVAPSWGPDCIFERYGAEVVGPLLDAGFEVLARPHPMTRKRTPDAIPAVRDRFGSHPRFVMDDDIAAQDALLGSDLMVSDWSGAALEYAFGVERPVLFVDVPRKVNNPGYERLDIVPFEVSVRERIGEVVAVPDLAGIGERVRAVLDDAAGYRDRIVAARDASIFNVGRSGEVGAEIVAARADAVAAGR